MPLSLVQPPSCKLGPGPFPQDRPGGSGQVCTRCFTFEGSGSQSVTRGWKPQPSTEAGLRAPSPCRSSARVLGSGHPLLGVLGHACVTQFPCASADRVWNGARASIQPGGVVTPGRRAISHGAAIREGRGEGRSGGWRPEGSRGGGAGRRFEAQTLSQGLPQGLLPPSHRHKAHTPAPARPSGGISFCLQTDGGSVLSLRSAGPVPMDRDRLAAPRPDPQPKVSRDLPPGAWWGLDMALLPPHCSLTSPPDTQRRQ